MSFPTHIRRVLLGRWRLVCVSVFAFGALAGAVVAIQTPAGATTVDEAGLPVPKHLMAVQWGHPLVGQTFVSSISRQAGVISGLLDVAGLTEGEPEWFYGQLSLYIYEHGKPMTMVLALYPFEYIGRGRVTANLIPPATISGAHETGIPAGKITFTGVRPLGEIKDSSEEPPILRATFTLKGHGGPFVVEFKRAADVEGGFINPYVQTWPKATQIGKPK